MAVPRSSGSAPTLHIVVSRNVSPLLRTLWTVNSLITEEHTRRVTRAARVTCEGTERWRLAGHSITDCMRAVFSVARCDGWAEAGGAVAVERRWRPRVWAVPCTG